MDSRKMKPDAPPPWRPPGAGTSAWPQRGDRRGLPPRPPAPPPRRRPPPPHAVNGRRGEGRSAVSTGVEAEGAGSGDTRRGVPRREAERAGAGDTRRGVARRETAAAGRNAEAVAELGAQEAAGPAEAREERVPDGEGRKRLLSPPAQPPAKRRAARGESGAPPDWCKQFAIPLGRNRNAGSSRPRVAALAYGGSGAQEKAAPRPPLAGSKDAVLLGEALPRAAGMSMLNKAPAVDDTRPVAGGGHHDADTRVVEPLEASHRSTVAAADGWPDTGSQESAGYGGFSASKGVVATATDEELQEGKNACKVHPVKASIRHSSNKKTGDNKLRCLEKSLSQNLAKNVKVLKKSGGSCNVVVKSSSQGISKEHLKGKKVSEIGRMSKVSSDVPARMSSQSIMTGNKIVFAHGKTAKSAKVIEKSKVKEKEAKHGRLVAANWIVDTDKLTSDQVMDKRPMARNDELTTNRVSFGPKKKGKVKTPDHHPIKVVYTLGSKEELDNKVAFYLKDDDVLKAAAVCEGELQLYVRKSSDSPSLRRQIQHGVQNTDARSKFKMICRRFEFICRVLVQAVEQHSLNLDGGRIDILAARAMKELPDFSKPGPVEGKVPGVEVGDEFLYRVQLAVVGLHRCSRGGIDWTKDGNGTTIAVSIVCSGGYPDEMPCPGELIYTGSGGELAGKKHDANQRLNRGNLALKNCINTKTPVRVIYGFKSDNVEEHSHPRAKKISTYTYDGLYHVVHFWEEGNPGLRMFKYMLKKIPEQPELPLYIAERMRKSKKRPGLRKVDISERKEATPIYVVNRVDDGLPAPFKYITRIKSALCPRVRPTGCGCTDGCSDSDSCSCASKNGGKFQFNFNGVIVCESPFIFECGPSCKCPPSCHNRVGQHGIKIPLEVFRTSKTGWGIRSLRSISSGSFVCEYVGELRQSMEADQIKNRDYLFNIGRSKRSQPRISGLNSSGTFSGAMDDVGFTIDATEYGNVGRFINHSCSPNLFAQKVLFDHGDKRMPHIMFFAAETIPPLQELTCEYK